MCEQRKSSQVGGAHHVLYPISYSYSYDYAV